MKSKGRRPSFARKDEWLEATFTVVKFSTGIVQSPELYNCKVECACCSVIVRESQAKIQSRDDGLKALKISSKHPAIGFLRLVDRCLFWSLEQATGHPSGGGDQ